MFPVRADSKLYNEGSRPEELGWKESLEWAVEDRRAEMAVAAED
jgi:hypothetical protein